MAANFSSSRTGRREIVSVVRGLKQSPVSIAATHMIIFPLYRQSQHTGQNGSPPTKIFEGCSRYGCDVNVTYAYYSVAGDLPSIAKGRVTHGSTV